MTPLRSQLGRLTDLLDPLSPAEQHALYLLLAQPTAKRWEAAYRVCLRPADSLSFGLNLWEAWIATDPHAPLLRATVPWQPWPSFPTRQRMMRAIAWAVTVEASVPDRTRKAA